MVKVLIETPYDIGTEQHANLMYTLDEINRDNNNEYTIRILNNVCDECGAINDTVEETIVGEECGQSVLMGLCDHCVDLLYEGVSFY